MSTFTILHVAISLVALAAGFAVLFAFLSRRDAGWGNGLFLSTTVATSVSGFGFPAERILPSHVLSVLSLIVLAVALYAYYGTSRTGFWQRAYVATATIAQYFNFFVLIVQSFQKVPVLHALAPTQTELPFAAAQLAALAGFLAIGILATLRVELESEPQASPGR